MRNTKTIKLMMHNQYYRQNANPTSSEARWTKIALLIGIFFLIFSPHLNLFGLIIKTVYVFVFIPGILGLWIFLTSYKKNKITLFCFMLIIYALAYNILLSSLFGFKDYSIVQQLLMGLVTFFAANFYINKYKSLYHNATMLMLMKDLNMVGLMHSTIVLLTFFSLDFKEFLYHFISTTELSHRYLFEAVENPRYQGIVHSGFSFLSTIHALLLSAGIFAFFIDHKKYGLLKFSLFITMQIVIFLSIILIGRTGLIVTIIFIGSALLYGLINCRKNPLVIRKIFRIFVSVSAIIFFASLFISSSDYDKEIRYAFETYYQYTEFGELDRSTKNVVEEQFCFPDSRVELFLGTGNFGNSVDLPEVNSDVGYVRFVSGAGIFGTIISYLFLMPGIWYAAVIGRQHPIPSLFVITFSLMIAIVNLKDFYYFGYNDIFTIYFLVLFAFVLLTPIKSNQICT